MEPFGGLPALLPREHQPVVPAPDVFACRHGARASRHPMKDSPQDRGIRFRSAVRPVQHLQPLFDDRSIGHLPHGVIGKAKVSFP